MLAAGRLVATNRTLAAAADITQMVNDKEQLAPMIEKIQALPLRDPVSLLFDGKPRSGWLLAVTVFLISIGTRAGDTPNTVGVAQLFVNPS